MSEDYVYAGRWNVGDKVLFHGLKAKVVEFSIRDENRLWAVPICILKTGVVTLAHDDALQRRGKA